ncbi:hypothetical protein BpHYR1_024709 [Brachionus plicatilis]|uniref:Uncharacterized protein n=1 Tax=Brachionus plicatilis TaxID=10195 RepID=A0A3M7SBH8_BRAPC|nr:hypothetical protein BpHYR1_024709 [Brachionus plicatilis]
MTKGSPNIFHGIMIESRYNFGLVKSIHDFDMKNDLNSQDLLNSHLCKLINTYLNTKMKKVHLRQNYVTTLGF